MAALTTTQTTADSGSVAETLLADRGLISLSRARLYLASRARVRTPLGGAEFLGVVANHERETYDKRVQVALDCIELYREFFADEYARSSAPAFSILREHEFYSLVHEKLFPVMLGEGMNVLDGIRTEPNYFLPYVPVRGVQRHAWMPGGFLFHEIETPFHVAHAFAQMFEATAYGRGWQALKWHRGLAGVPDPLEPTGGAVGWSLFVYSCTIEDTPLKSLPLAFHMISYKTGNPWLDLPPLGFFGHEWSREQLVRLHVSWLKAQQMGERITELARWFDEEPQGRIARAVELWNKSITAEAETGFAGVRAPEGRLMRHTLDGETLRRVYGDDPLPIPGGIDVQAALLRPGTGAFYDLDAAQELLALLED